MNQLRWQRRDTYGYTFDSQSGLAKGLSLSRTLAAAKCWLESHDANYAHNAEFDKNFNLAAAIKGTRYENNSYRFVHARDAKHVEIIIKDIQCEGGVERM